MSSVHVEDSDIVSKVVHGAAATEDVYGLYEVILHNINIPC